MPVVDDGVTGCAGDDNDSYWLYESGGAGQCLVVCMRLDVAEGRFVSVY